MMPTPDCRRATDRGALRRRVRSRLINHDNHSNRAEEDAENEYDNSQRHNHTEGQFRSSFSESAAGYSEDSQSFSREIGGLHRRLSSSYAPSSFRQTSSRGMGTSSTPSSAYVTPSWYPVASDGVPTELTSDVLPTVLSYTDVDVSQRPSMPSDSSANKSLDRCFPLSVDWVTPSLEGCSAPDTTSATHINATADRVIRAVLNPSPHSDHSSALDSATSRPVHFTRHITVFAGLDPDAVCCVSLLKESLSERFGVNIHVIPISCFTQLRHAFAVECSRDPPTTSFLFQSACLFFINAGSRHDVRELLVAQHKTPWNPRILIVDYHRPVSPLYFLRQSLKSPCFIVSVTEELDCIKEECQRRTQFFRQSSGKNGGDELELCDSLEDDEDDLIDAGDSYLDPSASVGEYYGPPSSFVVFEALRRHNLETPGMFFVVATALGYHLLTGNLRQQDYATYLSCLHDGFHRMRRRCWKTDRDFDVLKTESKELLLPLLRFTSVEDALRNSALFLRAQVSRFATTDVIEHELAALRVQLALQENSWKDQFRFLTHREQQRLLHRVLPDVLKKATVESRRRLPQRYPDDEETQHLVSVLAFVRLLSVVGLPDRVSSLDFAFLVLSLLSRPSPSGGVSQDSCPTVRSDPTSLFSFEETVENSTISIATQTNSFRPLHEAHGYSQPLFGRPFMEALHFVECLSHTNEQYASNCNACFDASVAFSNEPIDTSAANNGTSAVQKSNEPTVWFLGNIWDTYIGHTQSVSHYMGFSHEEVYQALARLTRVALQLQRDMMRLVLRVLAKRRPGLTQQSHYRRAVGNIEGFVEESVPQHLHHPLLLRYCAFVASDCIARGVCSALPDILLFAAAPPNCIAIGSIILGASPNATMRTPSKLGWYIQDGLEHLRLSGMLDNASQDDFDAATAYVPNNKLHTVFTSLFSAPPNAARAASFQEEDTSSGDDKTIDSSSTDAEEGSSFETSRDLINIPRPHQTEPPPTKRDLSPCAIQNDAENERHLPRRRLVRQYEGSALDEDFSDDLEVTKRRRIVTCTELTANVSLTSPLCHE